MAKVWTENVPWFVHTVFLHCSDLQGLNSILVPARGLEPRTLGLKVRYDLRTTPPQASC
jgi:hypothetical protein